jgi:hypothetical protein
MDVSSSGRASRGGRGTAHEQGKGRAIRGPHLKQAMRDRIERRLERAAWACMGASQREEDI